MAGRNLEFAWNQNKRSALLLSQPSHYFILPPSHHCLRNLRKVRSSFLFSYAVFFDLLIARVGMDYFLVAIRFPGRINVSRNKSNPFSWSITSGGFQSECKQKPKTNSITIALNMKYLKFTD
jgi:hypothetical protein